MASLEGGVPDASFDARETGVQSRAWWEGVQLDGCHTQWVPGCSGVNAIHGALSGRAD